MRRRAVLVGVAGLGIAAALGTSGIAQEAGAAEERGAVRIAVLDVERVRRNAAAVNSIRTQLDVYLESYRTDAQKEEQALRDAQDGLAAKRENLPPEAYAAERKKLEDRLVGAQERVQRRRDALERVNADAMEQVKTALETIVTEIAAERNLNLILRKDMVVFTAPAFEITEDVLRRLDQRLPTVKIADPGG